VRPIGKEGVVAVRIQVVVDAWDPGILAEFWAEALGYVPEPPPAGYTDWESCMRSEGVPEADWDRYTALIDPDGVGPRLLLQKVPEGKVVKNRVHLDLSVSGGREASPEQRRSAIGRAAARLQGLGASMLGPVEEPGSYWVVMQDPEGNEFCLH
jgi:hypothetical protein